MSMTPPSHAGPPSAMVRGGKDGSAVRRLVRFPFSPRARGTRKAAARPIWREPRLRPVFAARIDEEAQAREMTDIAFPLLFFAVYAVPDLLALAGVRKWLRVAVGLAICAVAIWLI